MSAPDAISKMDPFYENSDLVNIVIDTPKGTFFKLKFVEDSGIFRIHKALPLGIAFPFNFGFIPSTSGGDGDPLDVVLLTDYIFPVGAVLLGRLLSVLRAEQSQNRKKERNDRLIALPVEVESRRPMQPIVDFNSNLRTAIVAFFTKYNELEGRKFRSLGYAGARVAIRTVKANMKEPQARPNAS